MNIRRIAGEFLGISAFGLALLAAFCATASFDTPSFEKIIYFFASIAVISIVVALLSLSLDLRIGFRWLLLIVVPSGYAIFDALGRLGLLSL